MAWFDRGFWRSRPSSGNGSARSRGLGLAAAVLTLGGAGSAGAGPLTDAAPPCAEQVSTRAFAAWGDRLRYTLVPDGGLEAGGAGWTLGAGATVVAGSQPFAASGRRSLRLTGGSAATTPAVCVSIAHPTMRFFVRNAGSPRSTLSVSVVFENAFGNLRTLSIGAVAAGDWTPTSPLLVVTNLLSLLRGGETAVAFRFAPTGQEADWRVDDVYVDPFGSR